jgi:hypothetical protein
MAEYSKHSPWSTTLENNMYLELINIRPVPAESDDYEYTIETQYEKRPDLLAYDLYGSPKLWWVFAQRNMDTIRDPIFDFKPGVKIYCPKKSNLQKFLGV